MSDLLQEYTLNHVIICWDLNCHKNYSAYFPLVHCH